MTNILIFSWDGEGDELWYCLD